MCEPSGETRVGRRKGGDDDAWCMALAVIMPRSKLPPGEHSVRVQWGDVSDELTFIL